VAETQNTNPQRQQVSPGAPKKLTRWRIGFVLSESSRSKQKKPTELIDTASVGSLDLSVKTLR